MTVIPAASVPADDVVGSVGIVVKQTFSFGSADDPFLLENRQAMPRVDVAYETYGQLNARRDNVILALHGLTGSSHAAGKYAPQNRSVGYWDGLIGPGKVFDTDRFFVVAANSLGGCRGTTGPLSLDPTTGKPYGLRFPIITIRDMVRVQARLLDHLGIEKVRLVTGGSMGGMQALEWAVTFPDPRSRRRPDCDFGPLFARGASLSTRSPAAPSAWTPGGGRAITTILPTAARMPGWHWREWWGRSLTFPTR